MQEHCWLHVNSMCIIKNHIVSSPEIIQHKLLKPNEFATYTHKHGLSILNQKYILGLWNLGLLQADLIYSEQILNIPGLTLLSSTGEEYYTYYDNRIVPPKEQGWGGAMTKETVSLDGVELYFHPFRFYVLYHIERVLGYKTSSVQYLLDSSGARRVVDWENEHLDKWTGTEEFNKKIHDWNQAVDLAVFVEPCAFGKIFNTVRWSFPDDIESFNNKKETRLAQIESFFKEAGLEKIEEIRQQLCKDAEIIDDNKMLHIILRMMNVNMCENLKGRVGGAMLLLSMAEMLRHASEITFGKELREEDELGFGVWMKDVKKDIYGSNRLYDASRLVKNEFIRQYGLDYGVRVRCYVEGDTEAGALKNILGVSAGIEIINLKGKVVEKGITAFRDSLRKDINSQIFSVIIIDKDNDDYVRAIRKAAENDEICGLFFLSEPDFELGNFDLNELAEIVANYAEEKEIDDISLEDIKRSVRGSVSGKELMQKVKRSFPALSDIAKGEEWGGLLMDYAAGNPQYKIIENNDESERPIIEIVNILLRSLSIGYQTTRTKYTVSSETGKLIGRSK